MNGCCRTLQHLQDILNHGAWTFKQAAEENETDRSRLSCTPICYHKQKRRDLLQNKVGPPQIFWKRIWSVSHSIAPSTLTAKLLTREKASLRNKKRLSCKCDQLYLDNFSLPVSLAATRVVLIPFPRTLARSADLAFALSRCSPFPVPHI